MNRLERIQRFSAIIRCLFIAAAAVIAAAILIAAFSPGQGWVSVADSGFSELWTTGAVGQMTLIAIISPILLTVILGVYWLQRLFGEYHAGRFFTDGTMRCYIWLVWLKAFYFVYSAIFPLIPAALSPAATNADLSLTVDAGTLVELIVLIVIVHVLKAAQQINDENQAFI